MAIPLIVGAAVSSIGRYIASKGVKEAIKKFGKSAVTKARSAGKAVKDVERGISSRAGSKVVKAETKNPVAKVKNPVAKVKKPKTKTDAKVKKPQTDPYASFKAKIKAKKDKADQVKAKRKARAESKAADKTRAAEKKNGPKKDQGDKETPKTTTLEAIKGTSTRNRGRGFGLKGEGGKMATKAQRAENVASGRKRIGAGIGVASAASMFDGEKTKPVTTPTKRTSNTGRSGLSATQKAPLSTFKPKTPTAKAPLRSPSSDATAKAKAGRDAAKAKAGKDAAKAKKDAAKTKIKAAKQPAYMKYKTIAEAKKAGSSTYSKNGKEMAAVFKEDLKPGESLRDYMNARTGKTRKASNTPLTELSRNKDGTPADPKEFNKRIKDGTTLVNKRKGGDVKKMKKMNMGGMTKAAYKAGGKLKMVKGKDGKMVPDYAADGVGKMKRGGGVKKKTKKMNMGGMTGMPADGMDAATMMAMKKKRKKPMMPAQRAMGGGAAAPMMKKGGKVRGAGIARKGVRAAKMR